MIDIVRTCAEKAGGVTRLASALGIHHASLHSWTQVPAERLVALERITGIPRQKLRPDLFEGMTREAAE